MKKYNISTNLIQVIKNLYNKATSAVLFNSSIGDWFRTTVGVRQGCQLSPTLFNIFLERIVTDALEDYKGTVIIIIIMEISRAPYLSKILQPKARTKAIQTTITSQRHTHAHTRTHTHTHTHTHPLTHVII